VLLLSTQPYRRIATRSIASCIQPALHAQCSAHSVLCSTQLKKLKLVEAITRSRDGSVGIATGCRLDGRRWIPGRRKTFFSTASRRNFGAHLVSYLMGTGASFPAGKADHSPPSSAENRGAIPPLPLPRNYEECCIQVGAFSTDENKQNITVQPLFKNYKRTIHLFINRRLRSYTCFVNEIMKV
jgi:hypothetical protein